MWTWSFCCHPFCCCCCCSCYYTFLLQRFFYLSNWLDITFWLIFLWRNHNKMFSQNSLKNIYIHNSPSVTYKMHFWKSINIPIWYAYQKKIFFWQIGHRMEKKKKAAGAVNKSMEVVRTVTTNHIRIWHDISTSKVGSYRKFDRT